MGWGRGDGLGTWRWGSEPAQEPSGWGISIPGDVCWSWTCVPIGQPGPAPPAPSRHGRPPMGHDTRGHAAGAQGHQGHTHPSCDHSSFIDGARAAAVRRPGVSGTLAPQTPSAGVYSAAKPVSPTLPPAPCMPAAACRRPAAAPPIPAARAALVVARAAAAAPAPAAGLAAPGPSHAGTGRVGWPAALPCRGLALAPHPAFIGVPGRGPL